MAAKHDEVAIGPDLPDADGTITQVHNSFGVVRSMKRNWTEAKNNIESVREAMVSMEGQSRQKIKTLRLQFQIA